jgi:FkbM family methyltransferase
MKYDILWENIKHVKITSLLDIGCHVGNFTNTFKSHLSLDPSKILCMDINTEYEKRILSLGYRFIGAGIGAEKKIVPVYYPLKPLHLYDPRNMGVSYYKESTDFFKDCTISDQAIYPLDDLILDEIFDFIKIDVQGAEYDVIFGGKKTISKAKCLLAETSTGNYNLGCKKEQETIELLNSMGFMQKAVVDEFFRDGKMEQRDILFLNKEI